MNAPCPATGTVLLVCPMVGQLCSLWLWEHCRYQDGSEMKVWKGTMNNSKEMICSSIASPRLSTHLEHPNGTYTACQQQPETIGQNQQPESSMSEAHTSTLVARPPGSNYVILVPLIGITNEQQAWRVLDALLRGLEKYPAHTAILDMAGVPCIDAQVAAVVEQVARRALALNSRVVLTGVAPAVARTLQQIAMDMRIIIMRSSVQEGIAYALEH